MTTFEFDCFFVNIYIIALKRLFFLLIRSLNICLINR